MFLRNLWGLELSNSSCSEWGPGGVKGGSCLVERNEM